MERDDKKTNGNGVDSEVNEKKSAPASGSHLFTPENRPPGGRPKGVQNKLTMTFKNAAEMAFEKGGGVDWLVRMMNGTASDRAAVLGLFGRLVPAQLIGQVDHRVKVELAWLGQRGIGRIEAMDTQSPAISNNIQHNQQVTDVVPREVADGRGMVGQAAGQAIVDEFEPVRMRTDLNHETE